jgi:hypothetical protein
MAMAAASPIRNNEDLLLQNAADGVASAGTTQVGNNKVGFFLSDENK